MVRPFISLCMIVKNEELVLGRCLDSVKEYIDEVIIVDTGSNDSSVEIATKYTNKIYYYKWNNSFADARNFAASNATGEWILVLDADEYVDPNNFEQAIKELKEKELDKRFDIYAANVINFSGLNGEYIAQHKNIRLYRNDGSMEYSRSVHEQVRRKDNTDVRIGLSILMVYHSGYLVKTINEKDKNNRNLPLIEKELNKNPIAFDFFNLANEYKMIGDIEKAVDLYVKAFQKKESYEVNWLPYCLCNMVECLLSLERYSEALDIIQDSLNIYPNSADFIYLKGIAYLSQKRLDDAKRVFMDIVCNPDKYNVIHKSPDFRDYLPYKNLGLIHEFERDYTKAIQYYNKVLNFNKYCLESAVQVLRILSKFHTEHEVYEYFSKNILTKNVEFNKKLLIFSLNQGLTTFAESFNNEYQLLQNIQDSFQLKLNIINGNYNIYNRQNIESATLLSGLKEMIIDVADLFILFQNIDEITSKRKIKVLIDQSNLSTLLNVLLKEGGNMESISIEGYLYLIEKSINYKKYTFMNKLLELRNQLSEDINGRIANIFYSRGFENESIEFYEEAGENTLKEHDFCNIVDWLISKGDINTALEISEKANNQFSYDFRFYKYMILLNNKLGINNTDIIKRANEIFKET